MEDFKTWLEPLLYLTGAIVALIVFYGKAVKPIIKSFQNVEVLQKSIDSLEKKMDSFIEGTNDEFTSIQKEIGKLYEEVSQLKSYNSKMEFTQQAIVRDRIVRAYRFYKDKETMSEEELETVFKLYESYKANGGNSFVTKMIEELSQKSLHSGDSSSFT